MFLKFESTKEFDEWLSGLTDRDKAQIVSRIQKLRDYNYFGDVKNLGAGLAELRWKNGRRIYFVNKGANLILLLIGGLKNAQKKDIKKARLLFERYTRD